MKNTTKFLLGFVAGAVTGAALGILFAPNRGEDTRKLISDKVDELAKKGKDFYESKRGVKNPNPNMEQ